MTLQYQPRFGGAVNGRRIVEVSKDAGTRTRNAAIGAGIGGAAAYEGTGLLAARGAQLVTGTPKYTDAAKPFMRHWNTPSSMKTAMSRGHLKGVGAVVGGGAAIGAGLGALRGGKKPQLAPTYNTTYEKADNWRNISEHQTQAAQGRRRTRHGGLVASIGAGAMGAAGTEGLHQARVIARGHKQAFVNANRGANHWIDENQRIRPINGVGDRIKMHGAWHWASMKHAPLGHVTGAGAGALAVGGAMALSGAHKRRKHEKAITQLRRQRSSSTVGKSREFNPEARRQRHLGAAEAVSGLGGAGALTAGVRGMRNTTKQVRFTPTAYREHVPQHEKARAIAQNKPVPEGKRIRVGDMNVSRHLIAGKRRDVLLAAGGLAGLGAAGAIHNHSHSARGRTWY